MKIDVLDKGFIRLVDKMGSDLSISRAARVSYDADWRAGLDEKSDAKLIKYLWKNKHTTPFEAVTFTFEVKAPIFVFRQWHRHRTQSYNELSARYKELPNEYYVPDTKNIGIQSKNSKQARDINDRIEEYNVYLPGYTLHCEQAFNRYNTLLEGGWPRELARMVLPLSTYSHMFCTLNLRNALHFCELRTHEHAQYEIQVYANAMLDLIKTITPTAVEAFNESR